MKWIAMEELLDSWKTRGSFIFKYIARPRRTNNIKDIIRHTGEPKFKPLVDKLVHFHKLLFASRLLHYDPQPLSVLVSPYISMSDRNRRFMKPS